MVLPLGLLLAGGGAGLQMVGQKRRENAQEAALAGLRYNTQINEAGQQAEYDRTGAALGNLEGQFSDSAATAVDDLSAANMRGAFGQGSGDLDARISGVLSSTPQAGADAAQAAVQNTAFTNAKARTKMRNDINTDALVQVLKNNAGLSKMNDKFRTGMADKGDRDSQIRTRIEDVLRLQNYADGVRSAALQRAGAEHGLDQARAASVGSGAMYLGALMQAGAPLLGGGGQAPGTELSGMDWMQGLFGTFGNPANGVDYTPNDPNSPQV